MQRYIAPLVIGIAGIAILLYLGTWQMQRLGWKRGVLEEIETTIAGAAQPLPRIIDPSAQRYMPVALNGEIGKSTLRVLVSVKHQGAGYRLISPFTTDGGRTLLLDRGFLPTGAEIPAPPPGKVSITGNLHWPDDRNASTPKNDWIDNVFFARDIGEMSEGLKTEPLLVVTREMSPSDPGLTPLPVDTNGIPNDHLQYAITWYSLAAVWLIMTGVWIRRLRTGREA